MEAAIFGLLLISMLSIATTTAYTPSNFYPALRGSSLFPQRGRPRFWAPKAAISVQPRTQDSPEEEADEKTVVPGQQSEFPLLSPKDKRLMGIFRCYGWGPSCSDNEFFAPKQRTDSTSSSSSSARSRNNNEISNSFNARQSGAVQQRPSSGTTRFEPFFTLTSGGSWGPTGKKRDGSRRYSIAEKRLDFLKQILRDMLEEIDEDGSSGDQRALGLRRRTKRYATYRGTQNLLSDYERPIIATDPWAFGLINALYRRL